jgi:bifunctional NMN adenylyltransferase/nudix hydrolase
MKNKLAVIVGRFQSEAVCDTMDDFISQLLSDGNDILILLGLSPIQATKQNPLDFETRKLMLREKYVLDINEGRLHIGYVKDARDDNSWSDSLDEQIERFIKKQGGETQTMVYGGEHTMVRDYNGKYAARPLPTEIYVNEEAGGNQVPSSVKATKEFRQGVLWAVKSRYPTAYSTVDVAVFDGDKLLLARKPNEDKYRFIGGFVDPREKFIKSAKREVKEEANIGVKNVEYVDSFVVDDWRYRREADSITTTLFTADYDEGIPRAQDDIESLMWFDMNTACRGVGRPEYGKLRDILVPEHDMLADAIVDIFENRLMASTQDISDELTQV